MFVWGIDPGLSRCGYAVLDASRRPPKPVALGVFTTPPSDRVPERLHAIQTDVRALAAEHPPVEVAVERILFSVNVRTAIGVAQCAGVVMTEAVDAGAAVSEYSPNEIKLAVAGDGSADKDQVEAMVQRLLRIDERIRPVDAADAAAIALCHLAHAPLRSRVAAATGGAR
ncbi:MAG: crossover junction endodeoxyribonuclease RuvC [Acidimicrobiales bacterium]|nr:crossover junction endodeoxyribonuclease RuvC [Acidimicrobiales bacterium]